MCCENEELCVQMPLSTLYVYQSLLEKELDEVHDALEEAEDLMSDECCCDDCECGEELSDECCGYEPSDSEETEKDDASDGVKKIIELSKKIKEAREEGIEIGRQQVMDEMKNFIIDVGSELNEELDKMGPEGVKNILRKAAEEYSEE